MAIKILLDGESVFECSVLRLKPDRLSSDGRIELREKFTDATRLCDIIRYKLVKADKFNKNCFAKKSVHQKTVLMSDKYKKIVFDMKYLQNSIGNRKIILLVLESPHSEEYTEKYKPLVPANGKSGKRIDMFIGELVETLIKALASNGCEAEYSLAIVNPIQWQTSLGYFVEGELHACLRDTVWRKMYSKNYGNCKKNFENMIEKLPNNSIIVNGCTGGKLLNKNCNKCKNWPEMDNCPINCIVMKSIIAKCHSTIKLFSTNHPVTWLNGKCRKLQAYGRVSTGCKLVKLQNYDF